VEAHAGNAAIPQQLLMTILPANIELTAEIYVPSRAVGFIHPGQKVRLVYDAFPRQKFGTFEGRVERISDFVLLPGDVPNTFSFQEATYRVHVTINDAQVGTKVGAAGLRPGMLLMAEMVLEKRTLIDWFLEPLGFTPELS
jgi:membrane fusion protein